MNPLNIISLLISGAISLTLGIFIIQKSNIYGDKQLRYIGITLIVFGSLDLFFALLPVLFVLGGAAMLVL